MNDKKFYIIRNKALALAIAYTTGEEFYTYDDKFEAGNKVYSFKYTDRFKVAFDEICNLRDKLNKK
ncbi:hypothetical protein ACFO6R_06435 [Eubacterium multiforme]|uniref:Uncharacterized protein n=1 Tax=Eubacterium multiforme TaxID=83339 RepID=A0ABT9USF3_9FIRM|nr:hypothetical protein [Eubacterium multiforme]MDQ0149231.1 hypothetical protein [Eubacterium multiforme]